MEEFNSSLTDVVKFTGVAILVLGFSNFIWVPISSSFGRRPVLIASNIVVLASMIWRARATTYSSFMGACVLNGIGAGPAETIQPAIIADIFFLHDRGFWNTFYWVFYMGSLMVAPSKFIALVLLALCKVHRQVWRVSLCQPPSGRYLWVIRDMLEPIRRLSAANTGLFSHCGFHD